MAKTIEQTYKKLSQRDHILHRSDMYVGSKDLVTQEMWVASIKDFPEEIKIMKKLVTYSPAFIKCFDEVLTNASDHYWRGGGVKYIKIKFDGQCFEVENDGSGIPIQIHKDENVYVPELIFGHLLAGSNFDDSEERMGGGRNGSGSKLTNIFSTKFIVETADGKKKYKQTFKDNMEESKKSEPTITNSDENYTIIKYWPDLKQFNMTKIDDDTLSLILKRIIDISAYCPKVRVSWNGKNIPIKSIKDWMEMHIETPEDGTKREFFYEQIDKNWEIGIAKTTGMSFEQVSVVNGISTHRGGNHVNDISRELSKIIYEQLAKKNRKMKFTWMDVKNNIILFLICKVPNPIFDTQTKECLTNNLIKDNTISFNFSESLIKKILKSDICESIIEWLEAKEAQRLAKESIKNAKVKVQKLIDANSKSRKECILYIYEGDCLEENTEIKVLNDIGFVNVKMKNLQLDDLVLTHNNNFKPITGISKKIAKRVEIKTKDGSVILTSSEHRLYVYDKIKNEFVFEKVCNINKDVHKIIKNTLYDFNGFDKILKIEKYSDEKYSHRIFFQNLDTLDVSENHKFCVFDTDFNSFSMLKISEIDCDKHYIAITYAIPS